MKVDTAQEKQMHWLMPAREWLRACALWRVGSSGLVLTLATLIASCCGIFQSAQAEEPYRQFLEKLRSEQLYDLALGYLDDLEKSQATDRQFAVEIPLERARLYQESAAAMGARSPLRTTRLDDAERAFQRFLEANKNHPRRSEARLGLGNLLLARAEEARSEGDPKQAKPEAVKYYGEAQKLFESALQELGGILTEMKGARIDAADESKKALRDKYRDDYRRAELLTAFATEHKGRSHAWGSPEWKSDLDKAQNLYNELYTHEKDRLEARNYALYYRSGIQRDFGKVDDAVDGYTRILAMEGIDELRPLQFKALTEVIKIWSSPEQNKTPAALELIAKWEKQIRPDERATQDVIDFTLAAARARIDLSSALQSKDPEDRSIVKLRKEARDSLQKLVRISGPHQQAARELSSQLGLTKERATTPIELPNVKNFDEAMKEAASRIEQMQSETLTQSTLQEELDKATDPAQKKEFNDQLAEVNSTLERARDQAAELLKIALRMFQGSDLSQLTDTRYRLAYVELQRGNPWDAIAIGEFLAYTNAGSETGLQCATVALAAYGRLITEADAQLQQSLTGQLQPFAEFMVQTWPNSSEAQAAASTLVQLAMNAGDFAKAQSYLDKLPAGTGKADKLRRDIGLVLAGQYFQERAAMKGGTTAPPELTAKRDAAIKQLTLAVNDLKKDELDSRFIEAINSLVRLQLAVGKVDDADKWISDEELAPVQAIRANPDLVKDRLVKLDTYRTALQATVSQLGSSSGDDDLMKQVEQLVGELRETAGADEEGQQLLTSIFVKVTRDLQDLVEDAESPAKKQKLANGMILLCKQVAATSEEFNTKFWAGQTLTEVANALDDSAKQTRAALQRAAVALLEDILKKETANPGWIKAANGDLLVRMTLAKAMRQAGQYQRAVDLLSQVLAKNPRTLQLQIEAAEVLQAWGDSGVAEKYDDAIYGAVSDGKGGKLIWGWGKLSQALAGKADLADPFFLSRYQLAVCLYRSALKEQDAKKKSATLARAEREIGATALLYPALGGPDSAKRFDDLLKDIQKALGKPPVGLTAKKS